MGFVWFLVIYVGSCFLLGGIAGGIAGARNPGHASESGRVAGQKAVQAGIPYILGGSLLMAIIGSATGYLPGTKLRKPGSNSRTS